MKNIARYLFIVGRDHADLYDALTEDYSERRRVRVLMDRRQGERRQRLPVYGPERRRAERRRRPFDGFAVLREDQEAS
ncbi:MAG: hypothetical protein ACE5JD_08910 [Candidatus Methylomirabilia bacterium]